MFLEHQEDYLDLFLKNDRKLHDCWDTIIYIINCILICTLHHFDLSQGLLMSRNLIKSTSLLRSNFKRNTIYNLNSFKRFRIEEEEDKCYYIVGEYEQTSGFIICGTGFTSHCSVSEKLMRYETESMAETKFKEIFTE